MEVAKYEVFLFADPIVRFFRAESWELVILQVGLNCLSIAWSAMCTTGSTRTAGSAQVSNYFVSAKS
jgi:hypothetical protein